MSPAELGSSVLKSVSRSFYLTIRLLPAALREPIGLAYLLARTSDTIADSSSTPAATRLELLAAFAGMAAGGSRACLGRIAQEIQPATPGESVLLSEVKACLDWLEALPTGDREEIRAVLRKIIHGQTLDLQRFATPPSPALPALQTAAELDEYTYLVAGCVGEFWTRLCVAHLPRYSRLPLEELAALGARFGQGLQLVNILRDLPEDLRQRRCYLPADELAAAGATPGDLLTQPALARPVFDRWRARAHQHLAEGARYLRAIRPPRLRMACFLPWHLGLSTLRLLEKNDPLTAPTRIKVPRRAVYAALPRALAAAVWNWPISTD